MATPLRERVINGYRFWRLHGAQVRRARLLCACADELVLRHPRRWRARSERLYLRTMRTLRGLHDGARAEAAATLGDWPAAAHEALRALAASRRAFGVALAALGAAVAGAATLVVLLFCVVSPGLRHRVFPVDLAAGRPWRASSAIQGEPESGVGPSSNRHLFMHTGYSDHPWVEIDLGSPRLIRSVRVVNRDDCCQSRAVPLNVEVLDGDTWKLVAQRHTPFNDWTHDVRPIHAQMVRVRLAGTSYLHLKRISIYGQ